MAVIGDVIDGRYKIIGEIGRGGMSVVYLAEDIRLHKKWAVKEIVTSTDEDSCIYREGLRMEAEVLKRLDHPVLPRIVDIIYTEKTACIVMDYVEGRPLNKVIKKGGVSEGLAVKWAVSLCQVLIYLHNMNPPIIYRDMKPSNIMLKPDGSIKLIDFGAAMEKNSGISVYAFGTKGYAAPEQMVKGKADLMLDARTDVYSLGATIYTFLTGEIPEKRKYISSLSEGLYMIVLKCMEYNPEDRYQSCEELLYHLNNYKKLERSYDIECRKNIYSFMTIMLLTVCFGVISVYGYHGIIKEKNDNYEKLLEQGFSYIERSDTEAAVKVYTEAINSVDGSRPESYLELLNLYKNYYDDPEKGLSMVTYYIDQKYEGIDGDDKLLMQVGMDYFELIKDYQKSAYYFGLIDKEKCPEAEFYENISMSMCRLDIDYKMLKDTLIKLENSIDSKILSNEKIQSYELICDVYVKNRNEIKNADKKIVEIAEKGLSKLDEYEDESVKAHYYIVFNQYLITGLEELGDADVTNKDSYYERALGCCDVIVEMVSKKDNLEMGNNKADEYRRTKLCKKAELLAKLSRMQEACRVYEAAEVEYGTDSLDIYIGHLSLLCSMEEQKNSDVERWDYELLHAVYEKGKCVPGIEEDYRWKRLMVKLEPLFDKT